jgi:fucose permease
VTPVAAATRATFIVFAVSGLAFASWASRIPQYKDELGLDPSQLGLVLLAMAAGSVLSLPLSGPVIARIGSRRAVAVTAVQAGAGLALVAAGHAVGVPLVVVGLFVLGTGMATWDVGMNVHGAVVERRLGRSIMSRFHAAFSLGTVAGALGGVAMVALGVSPVVHLAAVALLVATVVPVAVRRFVPDTDAPAEAAPPRARESLAAWREPRTVLVGLFTLSFAFAEGSGADWISVAMIEDYGASAAVGTLAFAAFLAAMTTVRWLGTSLLDRYGRVPVMRVLALISIAGLALFIHGPGPGSAVAGAVLWGGGLALGFPVGMSAGADEQERAAPRVSVISSIAYCAFLAGPPLIGFLGREWSVLAALTTVMVLLALALIITDAVRPPAPAG